jgi:hypothetical protein
MKTKNMTFTWKDRRPIGMINLASNAIYQTNPLNARGWFNDTLSDFTSTLAAITNFQTILLATADKAVIELKRWNAQGMIFWNPEGCPGLASYIGDPRLATILAPEIGSVIDRFFKKFTDAGLSVGCCLRPNRLTNMPNPDAMTQTFVQNPAQEMIDKAQYAKNRWGCKLFYCDSTVQENFPGSGASLVNNLPATVMQTMQSAVSGSLFIFENEVVGDYAFGSAYGQLNQGYVGPPAGVAGFGVICLNDADAVANEAALVTAVKAGNILMGRAWYQDEPTNSEIIKIYGLAAKN